MPPLKLPEGLPSAWLLSCLTFTEAIAPDPDRQIDQWADEKRILPPETSAEPGPWRTSRVPHTREPMQALSPSDPCQEVTFVAGTQVGKTEIGNNFIGFIMDEAPGPAMMVLPTSNTGKRTSRTRLAKMIESTPSLRQKISDSSRDSTNSVAMKEFPGGVLVIAGANSASELKSMPVRYLFEDEVDEYPDDVDGQGPADELAEKRTDTFVRKKIFRTSTPTEKGRSKIWRHWLKSDQRQYYVPCPACGHEQVLIWDQVRWETRKVWEITATDTGEIREVEPNTEGAVEIDSGEVIDVWYDCVNCAVRIEEYQKTVMLEGGRWIAHAPGVRRRGYHLSALYSPVGWYSWRTAVEKRIEADKDPTKFLLKIWTNTVIAEPYADTGDQVRALDLKSRADKYSLKQVPVGGLFLTAGIDIQQNWIATAVKAWGRGEESWLVDYQEFHGDTETVEPWERLAEYLHETQFTHEYNVPMRVLAAAIDTGYRTQTAYDFCRRYKHRNVFAVKGVSRPGKAVLGRPTAQDVTHRGVVVKNGVQLWPIGADTAKTKIYARLKITEPGPGRMHFPLGLPDEYYEGLVSERLITRYKHGRPVREFEKDAGARNEPLDVEVYAYAAALYAGMSRVNWDKLEAGLRESAGDLFVTAPLSPALSREGIEGEGQNRDDGAQAPAEDARLSVPDPDGRADAVPGVRRAQMVQPRRRPGFVNNW
jgi:phage terminase large subunit GpA-like protein